VKYANESEPVRKPYLFYKQCERDAVYSVPDLPAFESGSGCWCFHWCMEHAEEFHRERNAQ